MREVEYLFIFGFSLLKDLYELAAMLSIVSLNFISFIGMNLSEYTARV